MSSPTKALIRLLFYVQCFRDLEKVSPRPSKPNLAGLTFLMPGNRYISFKAMAYTKDETQRGDQVMSDLLEALPFVHDGTPLDYPVYRPASLIYRKDHS